MRTIPIRTIFAGTPEFAVPSLQAVLTRPEFETVAVYTQPDRPSGRGRQVTASPIKRAAQAAGIVVEQPERVTTPEALARFEEFAPELLVVAAYGLLLPTPFIAPPVTALNVHASILPRWRGAAPIQRALMAGDLHTGICIMRIVQRLDAGPVWLQRKLEISPDDTGGSLHDRLAQLGADALTAALDLYLVGNVVETTQVEAEVTYAAKLTAADRAIDWTQAALTIARQVRALYPAPAAVSRLAGLEVKILAGNALIDLVDADPGRVLNHGPTGISVATGSGVYVITELQPAGKQRMSAQAFSNGYGQLL